MKITLSSTGDFASLERFLKKAAKARVNDVLERYGREGVAALSSATPVDTGLTSQSWEYAVEYSGARYKLVWSNSNVVDGVPIAIILQYGHGTGNGGYVEGRDYINPAIRPVFDRMAESLWREVIG